MTRNDDRKARIRARMAATGENYTTASRNLDSPAPAGPLCCAHPDATRGCECKTDGCACTAARAHLDRTRLTVRVLDLLALSFEAYTGGDKEKGIQLHADAMHLDTFAVSAILGGMKIGQIPNPENDPMGWDEYLWANRDGLAREEADWAPPAAKPTPAPPSAKKPKKARTFGPDQLKDFLGLQKFQIERAWAAGLIPPADVNGRWSEAVALDAQARLGVILTQVGYCPDLGAYRAAGYLSSHLEVPITDDGVRELARRGLLDVVDSYKGNDLFDGRQLEAWTDTSMFAEVSRAGQRQLAADVVEYLRVRRSDVEALVDAGWLRPVAHADGPYSRKGRGDVPLYRTGDLDALLADPAIDWDAVRATPKGRPSPLRQLPPR